MNSTDRLLRAFIAASGFEIEETKIGFGMTPKDVPFSIYDYKVTTKESILDFTDGSDQQDMCATARNNAVALEEMLLTFDDVINLSKDDAGNIVDRCEQIIHCMTECFGF